MGASEAAGVLQIYCCERKNKMKKLLSLILATMMILSLLASCGTNNTENEGNNANSGGENDTNSGDGAAEPTVVRVAIGMTYNPFCFMDENNEHTGYDVDVIKAIDEVLEDYVFEISPYENSKAVITAVQSGNADVGSNCFGKTPEREESFLFPDNGYVINRCIVVTREDNDEINELSDLAGKVMPVDPGIANHDYAKAYSDENLGDNPLQFTEIEGISVADTLQWVVDGRGDAAAVTDTAYFLLKDEMDLPLKEIGVLNESYSYQIINQSKPEIKEAMDEGLEILRENGTLSEISLKWFSTDVFE